MACADGAVFAPRAPLVVNRRAVAQDEHPRRHASFMRREPDLAISGAGKFLVNRGEEAQRLRGNPKTPAGLELKLIEALDILRAAAAVDGNFPLARLGGFFSHLMAERRVDLV